jgi:hypothetical protein
MATREPPLGGRLHLRDHVLEEQERPVVDPGQASAESASEPLRLRLCANGVFNLLPLHAKRWICQQVVKPLVFVPVLGE